MEKIFHLSHHQHLRQQLQHRLSPSIAVLTLNSHISTSQRRNHRRQPPTAPLTSGQQVFSNMVAIFLLRMLRTFGQLSTRYNRVTVLGRLILFVILDLYLKMLQHGCLRSLSSAFVTLGSCFNSSFGHLISKTTSTDHHISSSMHKESVSGPT